jgi:hypothetical protein
VFASGSISASDIQASGAVLFSPQQRGYASAPVIVTFDVYMGANGGWWELALDRTTLVTTITYNDSEQPGASLMTSAGVTAKPLLC